MSFVHVQKSQVRGDSKLFTAFEINEHDGTVMATCDFPSDKDPNLIMQEVVREIVCVSEVLLNQFDVAVLLGPRENDLLARLWRKDLLGEEANPSIDS